jgi:hypothetical protein
MYSTRHIFIALTLFSFFSAFAHATEKNESDIQIEKVSSTGGASAGASFCKGTVPSTVVLNRVNLSAAELLNGVKCVFGDFDGNGFRDFVLYGKQAGVNNAQSMILFYKGRSVIKTQIIDANLEIFNLTDSERVNYPDFKLAQGLIKHAEGDSGVVYFYDKKSGLFKNVPYVYPKGYESGE